MSKKIPKIVIIAPLLPLRTGIAVYSHKLYTHLQQFIPLLILANKGALNFYKHAKRMKIIECWNFSSAVSFFSIINAIAQIRPNIIHLQLGYTWIKNPLVTQCGSLAFLFVLKNFFKLRIIVTLHGVITIRTLKWLSKNNSFLLNLLAPIIAAEWALFYKCLIRLADVVIVHNMLIKKALIKLVGEKFSRKIRIIPHGVDKARDKTKKSLSSEKRKSILNLLFIGFLRKSKGILNLINAFSRSIKEVPNLRLTIAGPLHIGDDPSFVKEILHTIKQDKLSHAVELIARFLSEDELDELIKTADIIVLPYEDFFYEASGVLARILDYSKPLICTKIPKFYGELEPEKDAIFIQPNNVNELYHAILLLAFNSKLRDSLGCNLKKKAQQRYWDYVAKMHLKLYLDVLKHEQ